MDLQGFKNFKIFKKNPKMEGDEIFDRLTLCCRPRKSWLSDF
jgi:DNA topoisomerase IB